MKTTKKCAFCGRMFTPNSGMQKYCTVNCADEAKKAKKKRQQDFYIDLDGHPAHPHVARALEELRSLCAFYKVLGTYPVSA